MTGETFNERPAKTIPTAERNKEMVVRGKRCCGSEPMSFRREKETKKEPAARSRDLVFYHLSAADPVRLVYLARPHMVMYQELL